MVGAWPTTRSATRRAVTPHNVSPRCWCPNAKNTPRWRGAHQGQRKRRSNCWTRTFPQRILRLTAASPNATPLPVPSAVTRAWRRANSGRCAGRPESKICCMRGSLKRPLAAKGEGARQCGARSNRLLRVKTPLHARKKNNTQERKRSVFAWKHDFSPVASAVPEEKQFFAGD